MRQEKWDWRFLVLARHIAQWSKDPSTKVGAVIADQSNRIISLGFNGPPRGIADSDGVDRSQKLLRTIHAEQNAILFSQRNLENHILYSSHCPCAFCAAMIIQTGIKRVVWPRMEDEFATRWSEQLSTARSMLTEAAVEIDEL